MCCSRRSATFWFTLLAFFPVPPLVPSAHSFVIVFLFLSRSLYVVVQVFELMRGLDKDCDSTIDLHEFASRFDPVFTRLNAKQDVREEPRFGRRG